MNTYEMPFKAITIVPDVDLTTHRYKFVTVKSNGKGILATAAGQAIGILQDPCNVDEPANTMIHGVSFVIFEGAVASGDEIEVGTDGKAKKLAAGKSVGICMVGGADGDIGSVLIK